MMQGESGFSSQPLLGTPALPVEKRYCGGRLSKRACIFTTIMSVLVTLAIVCVIVFVGVVPAKVRDAVESSTMDFSSIILRNPTNSSLSIDAVCHVKSKSSQKAKLHAATMTMYYGSKKIGTLPMPETMVEGAETTFSVGGQLAIDDMSSFTDFAAHLVQDNEVAWRLTATLTVTPYIKGLGPLSDVHDVKFDKQVTLRGMSGLRDVDISNFRINDSTKTQLLAKADVKLYNPSVFSFEVNYWFNIEFV